MEGLEDRCRELMAEQERTKDVDIQRDLLHLCASMDAPSRQLEHTVRTMMRLHGRPWRPAIAAGGPLQLF